MTVKQVQEALIERGYDLGSSGADGDAGAKTVAALTSFQRSSGLVPDGIAGPLTVRALSVKRTDNGGPELDKKSGKSPVPTVALRAEPDMPPWLTLASHDLGTHEGVGKANNPKVVAFFKDAGFPGVKDDATAWCAAFVGAQLKRSGFEPSGSLAARSYEAWGVGLKDPVLGCVCTKKRGNSSWQGHVFLVVGLSADGKTVFGLGGNQSDAVTVAAFKRSEVTSFRWPSNLPIPTTTKLPTTVAGAKAGVSEA
jgi:uncharacterized protein (TIGR02594 family)